MTSTYQSKFIYEKRQNSNLKIFYFSLQMSIEVPTPNAQAVDVSKLTPKLTFDNIVMKLTQEYNREDFKRYEATLLVKANPTSNLDADDCIDFDKLFMKIDQYFNDEKFEMKGFVGSIADISPSFVEKFSERYASFIDQDVVKNNKELKSPYYGELEFADDLTEIARNDSKIYDPLFIEPIKYDDEKAQQLSAIVFKSYEELIDEHNNSIVAEYTLKFREYIGKIDNFNSKVTTPFFVKQPLYSSEYKPEELEGVNRLRTEFVMLIKYIEATYKPGCDCMAILKALDQRIKTLGKHVNF